MFYLAIILAIISLAPLGLYIMGRIRDPFNPMILAGVLSYFIAAHRFFTQGRSLLLLLPESGYDIYLVAAILSVVGMYVGWWFEGRRGKYSASISLLRPVSNYNAAYLLAAALVCAVIGTSVHFTFYERFDVTGYLLVLKLLWVTAAILCVQSFFISPTLRPWAILVLLIALAPPIDRFLVYGQRGDTFRVAAIAELAYFNLGRRPTKLVFLTFAAVLAIVLATLEMTRAMVITGESPNRVSALIHVAPKFFEAPKGAEPDAGEEFVFGAIGMQACRDTGRFGYGRSLTIGLLVHFLPRNYFPDKDDWSTFHAGYDQRQILDSTGQTIPGGAAPTGFADGYFEFKLFCFIPWMILGYFCRKLWEKALRSQDLLPQGLFIGFIIAILYGITQDLVTMEVNLLYVFVPLPLIYKLARFGSILNPRAPALQLQSEL